MKRKSKQRRDRDKNRRIKLKSQVVDNMIATGFSMLFHHLFKEVLPKVTITKTEIKEETPVTEDAEFTIVEPKHITDGKKS